MTMQEINDATIRANAEILELRASLNAKELAYRIAELAEFQALRDKNKSDAIARLHAYNN